MFIDLAASGRRCNPGLHQICYKRCVTNTSPEGGAPASGADDAQAPAKALQKRALGVAFLTLFLDLLGFGIIIPIQPFYAESFGASPSTVTLIGASYSLMQFVFAPMWGALSDRIGRRPVVLISVVFGAAGFLVFGFASSLWMLFVARMIAGFGNANLGTVQALVADVTPGKDRARGMGIMGAAFGLGFVFGPGLGGVVGTAFGPTAPAFVAAGLGAINFVLALVLLPETRKLSSARAGERRGFIALAALGDAFKLKNVPALLVIIFVFTAGFSLMETALALFVEHEYVPKDIFGTAEGHSTATKLTTWLLVCVGVTAVIVQGGLIGRLRKRFGERMLVIVGCALIVVSFIGIGALPSIAAPYAAMFPLIIVLSVGSGLFSPSQSALMSRSVSEDRQGEMLGLSQSMSALGRIAGPAVSGLLFEIAHSAPFFAGAALIFVGMIVATRISSAALK